MDLGIFRAKGDKKKRIPKKWEFFYYVNGNVLIN